MAKLGDYTVVCEIGKGTFGQVFLVQKSQKQYALKKINLRSCDSKDREHAASEVRILEKSSHRNLVRYHDYFLEGDYMHILMEYCQRGSLRDYVLDQSCIGEQECVSILKQICEGLKYLHSQNIVHRDMKTTNILLKESMEIKIGDLALARLIDGVTNLTKVVGTPYYMSPEMIQGLPYDKKTDIWSLGCVFYEIATKKQAFCANTVAELRDKIESGTLSETEIPYCNQMNKLFRDMIQHDPEKRPGIGKILEFLHDHTPALSDIVHMSVNTVPAKTHSDQLPEVETQVLRSTLSSETLMTVGGSLEEMIEQSSRRSLDSYHSLPPEITGDSPGNNDIEKEASFHTWSNSKQKGKNAKNRKFLRRSDGETVQHHASFHASMESVEEIAQQDINNPDRRTLSLKDSEYNCNSYCSCGCLQCNCICHKEQVHSNMPVEQDNERFPQNSNKGNKGARRGNKQGHGQILKGKTEFPKNESCQHVKQTSSKKDDKKGQMPSKEEEVTWRICLKRRSADYARQLLLEKKIPDAMTLQDACRVFGRTSKVFKDICDCVCNHITQMSKHIKCVWAAYRPENTPEVVFVVIKHDTSALDLDCLQFKLIYRCFDEYSHEGKEVMYHKESTSKPFTVEEMTKLSQCLQKHTESLFKAHSNLGMISACSVKSKGYGRNQPAELVPDTCIVLYVHVKGLIPIQEEPFPPSLNGFPVDVREGGFELYGAKSKEYHERLKMGCAICNDPVDNNGQSFQGTLGAFIDVQGVTYCITSAHVLLNGRDMTLLKDHGGVLDYDRRVFQHVPMECGLNSDTQFGQLVKAIYKSGGYTSTGMEVAIIRILNRHPDTGDFPDGNIDRFERAGFTSPSQMKYNSGKVHVPNEMASRSDVIKFGCESEVTRGSFHLSGSAVRRTADSGYHMEFGYELHNQIEILSIGPENFAIQGDSGALVFVPKDGLSSDLRAIGILEGGTKSGTYIVTPIWSILELLGLPSELKAFPGTHDALERKAFPGTQGAPPTHPLTPLSTARQISIDSGLNSLSPDTNRGPIFSEMNERLDSHEIKMDRMEQNISHLDKKVDEMKKDITEEMKDQMENQKQELARQNAEMKAELSQQNEAMMRLLQMLVNKEKT